MRLTGLAWGLVCLLAAGAARADEPVLLTWNAPAGCPSGAAVRGQVERILGGATNHRVVARADVTEAAPADWSVHLVTDVDGARGERTLDANSCASLANATALIVALAVDPSRARAAQSTMPGARVAHPSAPELTAPQSAPPSHTLKVQALVAAGAAFDVGTLPSPAVAGQLALGALFGPLRLEVSGADWFAQRATKDVDGASEGVRIHLFDAALRACVRDRFGLGFELNPCLGASVVVASSDGFGPAPAFTPQHELSAWGAAGASLLAEWNFAGPWALRASVGADVPLVRRNFVVRLSGQPDVGLHRPSVVAGTASLGVELRFL